MQIKVDVSATVDEAAASAVKELVAQKFREIPQLHFASVEVEVVHDEPVAEAAPKAHRTRKPKAAPADEGNASQAG